MKKYIIFILLLTITMVSNAQEESSHLRFSLLTCSSGNDVPSSFGHSAIRLVDSTRHDDIVFNYGTYSFEQPHFVLKFLHGELDYILSINYFQGFCESYKREGREVSERLLNLTESQKIGLYAFLINNSQPKNRVYRYDFLIDNCATRIRDLFSGDNFTQYDAQTDKTYRQELRELYLYNKWWFRFGIDIILGELIDRPITAQEEMFLPCTLDKHLALYRNNEITDSLGCSAPLLSDEVVVQEAGPAHSKLAKTLSLISQPTIVFTVLALLIMILFIRIPNRHKLVRLCSVIFYTILGMGGLLIFYLWFGTEHIWTKLNWNLLWMNPLFLIPVCLPNCKARRVITIILSIICLFPVIFWWLIPQYFNTAVIPVIAIVVILSAFELIINPK